MVRQVKMQKQKMKAAKIVRQEAAPKFRTRDTRQRLGFPKPASWGGCSMGLEPGLCEGRCAGTGRGPEEGPGGKAAA